MSETNLILLDLETTGLDPKNDLILEIAACSVTMTEKSFSHSEPIHFYIKHDIKKLFNHLNLVTAKMHVSNNLLNDILDKKINNDSSKMYDLDHYDCPLDRLISENKTYYLCGNSIYFDLLFLKYQKSSFANKLSYRVLDLTSYQLMKYTFIKYDKKESKHRALDDVLNSLEVLKEMYKDVKFIQVFKEIEKAKLINTVDNLNSKEEKK